VKSKGQQRPVEVRGRGEREEGKQGGGWQKGGRVMKEGGLPAGNGSRAVRWASG
jgi:hypothetical protein